MGTPTRFPRLRGDGQPARAQDAVATTLDPVAKALIATPIMGAPAPAWIAPDLLADFVAVTGQAAPGYHKDALGYVHGKGRVSTAAGQAAGTAVYALGPGYRPKEPQPATVRGNGATYQSLTINPNGSITVDVAIAAAGTVDLAFTFLAEQ